MTAAFLLVLVLAGGVLIVLRATDATVSGPERRARAAVNRFPGVRLCASDPRPVAAS
jgi:hypothetical protein